VARWVVAPIVVYRDAGIRALPDWQCAHARSRRGLEDGGPVDLLERLLRSDEPSIRLQVRQGVQGAAEAEVAHMREQVRRSSRVATLLSERGADGTIRAHPYRAKRYGAHWVLVTLAELGYPAGDEALIPSANRCSTGCFQRLPRQSWQSPRPASLARLD
jgi:hypothetical protein